MPLLLSALPVVSVIVALVLGARSIHAAWLGVAMAVLGVLTAFPVANGGAVLAVWAPVLVEVVLIVGGGLLLSEVLRAAGAQKALAEWVLARAGRGVGMALLVVHGVTPFAESLTGFGIGITIGIPLLAHAGLRARNVAAIGLLGLCAVPWGSMGPGTLIAATMAGLSFDTLGLASAWVSVIVFVVTGLAAAWLASAPGERGAALLQGAASGLLLTGAVVLANATVGTAPAGALGALVVIGLRLAWAAVRRRGQAAAPPLPALGLLGQRALGAYAVLLGGVLLVGWALKWVHLAGAWHLLASPALWLFVAALWFARGRPGAPVLRPVWRSWRQVAPVTALFILLGVLMAASGMAASLAHALAQTGPWYLVVAPWVAGLGGFVTGSSSGANAMLAATQAEIARALGVGLLPFMAVHNVSAALLMMASPGKIEMACQLAPGQPTADRRWIQGWVLATALVALVGLALLNLVLARGWA